MTAEPIAAIVPPAALRRRPGLLERAGPAIRTVVSLAVGLILWELVGRYVVTDPLFFVPFSRVVNALGQMSEAGTLWRDISVSALEFGLGFGLASLIGVTLGIAIGATARVQPYVDPWISALYATPLVALTPFFILIFGIGVPSKVALVCTLSVFPALINTITGIRAVDRNYLEVARSFNLSRRMTFTKVLVPASLPFIVGGLRLASGRALIGVVVGELLFSSAGVGHAISLAAQTFNTGQLLGGVVIFALSGVLTTYLLRRVEAWLAPWREAA